MLHSINTLFQLKVELADSEPLIWRRFLIESDRNFEELHATIELVMNWPDYAHYGFEESHPSKGITDRKLVMDDLWNYHHSQVKISEILHMGTKNFHYYHCSFDYWKHIVHIENILTKNKNSHYPVCIAGERNCPPEFAESIESFNQYIENRKTTIEPVVYSQGDDDTYEDFDPLAFNMREINIELQYIDEYFDLDPYRIPLEDSDTQEIPENEILEEFHKQARKEEKS